MSDLAGYLEALSLPTNPEARGYPRLADFMAWSPATAIFPRFRAANLLNLLGLQAEVSDIHEQLLILMKKADLHPNEPKKLYSIDLTQLLHGEGGSSECRLKMLELRAKLKEYNTALLQQITLHNQPDPHPRDLSFLQAWLKHSQGDNSELRGPGSEIWFSQEGDGFNLQDKLTLAPGLGSQDTFTRMVRERLKKMRFILSFIQSKPRVFPARDDTSRDHFYIYSSSAKIISIGDKVATLLASLLTTIPIIILNFVKNVNLRLGLIVIFTFVFSVVVAFMSNAKRTEIFAASAAFAAVQVVFVGSSLSSNGT